MAPYIAEIGILVVLILAITLVQKVMIVQQQVKVEEPEEVESKEGFTSDTAQRGVIDLRQERQKLVEELGRVDIASHQYPSSISRSNVRVGLERLIAEIDRAL